MVEAKRILAKFGPEVGKPLTLVLLSLAPDPLAIRRPASGRASVLLDLLRRPTLRITLGRECGVVWLGMNWVSWGRPLGVVGVDGSRWETHKQRVLQSAGVVR